MQKELLDISQGLGIKERDVKIIFDIILHFAGECSYTELKHHILTIFRDDIKPEHWIVLGHLIGYCLATNENANTNKKQLSLCLRQN